MRVVLEEAVRNLVSLVAETLESEHELVDSSIWGIGYFSYLLSKKQRASLERICEVKGWQKPRNYSITVAGRDIKHILNSRIGSDNLTVEEVISLVQSALGDSSEIVFNKKQDRQAFMLNGRKKISINGNSFYGSLIVEVERDGLVLKTAYHLTYTKLDALKRGR